MRDTEVIILLLFCIAFLALVSRNYRIPFPIVLVSAGLCISLIPGLPIITLKSAMVFPVFLPPLLFYTAWNISWFTFKRHLRTIVLASFSLVFFTVFILGAFIHFLLPAFGWPVCFLLGAILSPPDAVVATSLIKGLGLHPRLITILEGESLLNDASALIAFKYALALVVGNGFELGDVAWNLTVVLFGGCGVGLILGYLLNLVHVRFVHDALLSVTFMLLAPFASYLLAEHLHFSGILAVVTTGLYLSFRADKFLTSQSRINGYAVWEILAFLLNSLVFILIGLQLKVTLKELSLSYMALLLFYSLLIVLAGLAIRFIWTVPNTLLPRMWSKKIRETEPFERRNILVFAWAGMKGIVSMTIALSLPATLPNQQAFPFRSEIIFITFFVILFTLLLQGLTLPLIVKKLRIPTYSVLAEEYEVRTYLLAQIKVHIHNACDAATKDICLRLEQKYQAKTTKIQSTRLSVSIIKDPATEAFNEFSKAELKMLSAERELTYRLRREGKVTEEVLHKLEREIDLEEARIRLALFEN